MRDWIYPTLIFVVFLYAMAFVLFYTYKGQTSYSGGKSRGSTTTLEKFRSEINKKIQ